MGYKVGIDRKQLTLIPVSIDDYIPEGHICRVIDAFTRQLDLCELNFKYAEKKKQGCRPYDPQKMLNLYIYGYLHRTRSSRRLEAETKRNLEVMWLMEGLTPDDKTICNFRRDNSTVLKGVFEEYVQMSRKLGLYGEEEEVADGTMVRANNSLDNHFNETVVKNELGRIEKKVEEYMELLEKGDKEDGGKKEVEEEKIKEALVVLKERKEAYEALKGRLEEEKEISTVDPDARMVRTGGDGRELNVGYNVQTVVDSKYHMIADFEVTNNSSDTGNLPRMMEKVKEVLEVEELRCLADKGYYDGEDIAACEANGISCLVAKRKPGGDVKAAEFSKDNFRYDAAGDRYVCPCGKNLEFKQETKKNGGKDYRRYANYEACAGCERRSECTKYKYREMWRLTCQDVLDVVDERMKANKEQYRKRHEVVEHVFGTVKSVWGYRQYLCRRLPKVTAETALAYLAYNIRRTVNIFKESGLLPVFER
ncbi:MAG: IS1182 family transposase [Treponema sp.]|nr:IS1182 family transposase [Treponema sp.]